MLVLSRKRQECVRITDPDTGRMIAEVRVLQIRGNRVRLAFNAPDNVQIMRTEVEIDETAPHEKADQQPAV